MFSEDCPDLVGIREIKLEETFIMIYNNIIKNKHRTKEVLLKEIKDVVNANDYQDKLNNLLAEKETIEKRLSKIIDMKLDDDIDRKALFIQKEKEPLEEIGEKMNELVRTKLSIRPGNPMFGTVLLDCDLIVYLHISDELLLERTKLRNADFTNAKNMQKKIEDEIRNSGLDTITLEVIDDRKKVIR